jgi:hypothetical protein
MNSQFIRKNATTISIVLFAVIYFLLSTYKPGFIFSKDGSIREFGVGQSNKTILPLWLVSLLLGILSYFFIMVSSSSIMQI